LGGEPAKSRNYSEKIENICLKIALLFLNFFFVKSFFHLIISLRHSRGKNFFEKNGFFVILTRFFCPRVRSRGSAEKEPFLDENQPIAKE
jgi:hypothetical protein